MSLLPELCATVANSVATDELGLIIGPHAERLQMLALSAKLALNGAMRVLDGGNSYNALFVARYIRRQTVQLDETLNRILLARAFTCYQMVTLLEETAVSPAPTLVRTPVQHQTHLYQPIFHTRGKLRRDAHWLFRATAGPPSPNQPVIEEHLGAQNRDHKGEHCEQ